MNVKFFLMVIISISIGLVAFADIQTLDSLGLNGNPLIPDYYTDYLSIPSFASLEYSNVSGLHIDVPVEMNLSSPATLNESFYLYPTLVFETSGISLILNPTYQWSQQWSGYSSSEINSSQYLNLQVSPSIKIGDNFSIGLSGLLYGGSGNYWYQSSSYYSDYNSTYTYISGNVGVNGSIKLGSTIMGLSFNDQIYEMNTSQSNMQLEILSQTLLGGGSAFRINDNFNLYTGGYSEQFGLSYFNLDNKNISGLALFGNFEEDNYSNLLELTDINATIDPFIQRAIGNFVIRAGLPLSFYYAPSYSYYSPGSKINLGPSYGVTYTSALGDFNLYYISSNFSILPTQGNFNLGVSYNTSF